MFISDHGIQHKSSLKDKKSEDGGGRLGKLSRIAKRSRQVSLSLTKKLEFADIIESMIDSPEHSNTEIIEMIRLM